MNPYKMAVNNVARTIRKSDANEAIAATITDGSVRVTAFSASVILGIAFCKSYEDVMADIINYEYDYNHVHL